VIHENSGDGKCTVIQNVRETSLRLPREESYDYTETDPWTNSRKGLRKLNYVNHNKTKMSNANNRRRKTDSQVSILVRIFDKYDGKLTKDLKEEAIRKTGLAWIQIYKWFFDHKVKKANLDRAYRLHYPFQIFKVIGPDGRDLSKPQPIFKVEKIDKECAQLTTSGKPLA